MLRLKIILLAVLPLFFATMAIVFVFFQEVEKLVEQQLIRIEENALAAKRNEIQHYMHMAQTAISHIYDAAHRDDLKAQQAVKDILNKLSYGQEGYFFAYTTKGIGVANPTQQVEGLDWSQIQDSQGRLIVKDMVEIAEQGGGYYQYVWRKPSSGEMADKMSYVILLDKWQWMLGTGVYLDDFYRQVEKQKILIKERLQRTFSLIFGIVTFAVALVFVAGLVINARERTFADRKLKQLTQKIVEFQEDERGRVSRELHDGISQILVSVKYSIELALERLRKGQDNAVEPIEKAAKGLQDTIGEVRRISKDLRPSVLDDIGLSAALESMCAQFGQRTGIEVHFKKHVFTKQLPKEVKTTLFRVAQEALTNIERHAGASEVKVELVRRVDGARLVISDDGIGFDIQRFSGGKNAFDGIGLRNMQERLGFHDAELSVWSATGEGTVIEAYLPNRLFTV